MFDLNSLRSGGVKSSSRSLDDDIVVVQRDTTLTEMCECCICFERYTNAVRAPVSMQCGHTFCKACITKLITGKLFRCAICQNVSIIGFGPLNKNIMLTKVLGKFGLLDTDPDNSVYTPPKAKSDFLDSILDGVELTKMPEFSDFFFDMIRIMIRNRSRSLKIYESCEHLIKQLAYLKSSISQWFLNIVIPMPIFGPPIPNQVSMRLLINSNPEQPGNSFTVPSHSRFQRINGSNLYRPFPPAFLFQRPSVGENSGLNQRQGNLYEPDNRIMHRLLGCQCPHTHNPLIPSYRLRCFCTNCSADCIFHQPL